MVDHLLCFKHKSSQLCFPFLHMTIKMEMTAPSLHTPLLLSDLVTLPYTPHDFLPAGSTMHRHNKLQQKCHQHGPMCSDFCRLQILDETKALKSIGFTDRLFLHIKPHSGQNLQLNERNFFWKKS